MELGSWSIIQAPSLLALIPLVVYIVLVFRGKNNVSGIIVGIFLAVLMLGQNLKAVSVGLAASLGSSTALIGIAAQILHCRRGRFFGYSGAIFERMKSPFY